MNPGPMELLSRGVPLTLLIDLFFGPHSEDLMAHETPVPRDLAGLADLVVTGGAI